MLSKGIYQLKIGGSIYIGSTNRSFEKRLSEHIRDLKCNKHKNYILQNLYVKNNNVEFSILEIVEDISLLYIKEQYIPLDNILFKHYLSADSLSDKR